MRYDQVARGLGASRGQALAGTLVLAIAWFVAAGVLYLPASLLFASEDGVSFDDPIVDNAVLLLALAVAIPATWLAVRVDGRPFGTLLSVEGRLRVRWLGRCVALAMVVGVPYLALGFGEGLLAEGDEGFDAAPAWRVALAAVLAVALVPWQAASEEVVFRGWLVQVAGRFVRRWWIPAVPISAVFLLGHEGSAPAFVGIGVFGLACAYLTIRTGGLEAAIALHVVGNTTGFFIDAFDGAWVNALTTNDEVTWLSAGIDVALTLVYVALVVRVFARSPHRSHTASSSSDATTRSAASSATPSSDGTPTTVMPAALAAATPVGESSSARDADGSASSSAQARR